MNFKTKRIFAFWEPKENMPEYLKLCVETWKKFLPDYEVVILDYSSLGDWLGEDYFDKSLYEYYPLAQQADAIRCALLQRYGGIWFDVDTIITSPKFSDFLNIESELIMTNTNIGFIIANANTKILNIWLRGIMEKIFVQRLSKKYKILKYIIKFINKSYYKKMNSWDCLGNSILDPYFKKYRNTKYFYSIDRTQCKTLPEITKRQSENIQISAIEAYRQFYFSNGEDYSDYAISETSGLICLHNSWTPEEYKAMSREEFLQQDITLTKLLRKILEI